MKRITYLLLFLIPLLVFSQQPTSDLDPEVGDNSEYTFWVKLTAFLEGPIKGAKMKTDLNKGGHIPLSQPYNVPPWNYDGPEMVDTMPNGNIVDWVYVELRNSTDPSIATDTTAFAWKAAFILNTGQVVDLDGSSMLQFDTTFTWCMYVAVWHRNHLGILSEWHLNNNGNNLFSYDFTSDSSQVYGGTLGCREVSPGLWGMAAGDANGDGEIDLQDKLIWEAEAGTLGYKPSDFNMNEQIDNLDKDSFFLENMDMSSFIPD